MVLRGLVALALLCSAARADDKPWAAGVSADDQQQALKLYERANGLFERGSYTDALSAYQTALGYWDHPSIHYNTAVCLMSLERWVDAYEHMQKALSYGEAPLGKDLHAEGLVAMEKKLKPRIGTLEVTLKTPGAVVKLDGKTLLDAPGTMKRNVLAAEPHQLVAEKKLYETETRTIRLEPGATTTLVLEMTLATRGKLQRRWARWKPWAVVAAGGLVGVVGLPLLFSARDEFKRYDTAFGGPAGCPDGCLATAEPAGVRSIKDGAELRQTLALSAFAVGGATIAAGIALVVLNQPRLVGATVTPAIGNDHVGASITTSW